jgi:hypothetical protein
MFGTLDSPSGTLDLSGTLDYLFETLASPSGTLDYLFGTLDTLLGTQNSSSGTRI